MKIACVADGHLWNHKYKGGVMRGGLNDRARLCLNTLNVALRRARVEAATDFVVAGDLVHHWMVEPQLLAAIKAEFDGQPFDVHLLIGNHDRQSYTGGDHALGVLGQKVYDYPERSKNVVFVPAPAKDAPENWLELALEEGCSLIGGHSNDLLVLHAGISDSETPAHMLTGSRHVNVDELAEICDHYGFKSVVAGDWHTYKRWDFDSGLEVVQIGALCPTGWGDSGLRGYGSVIFWDSERPVGDRLSRKTVPGPRFLTVDCAVEAATMRKAAQSKDTLFLRSRHEIEGADFAYDIVPEEKKYAAAEVVADVRGVREAIEDFVSELDLGEEVRGQVRDRAIRHVERAHL